MQFDFENLSPIYQKLTVVVPAQELEDKIESQIQDYAKKVALPGFRQGKAPLNVVRMKFYQPLREESIEKLINEVIVKATTEKSVQALSVEKVDLLENAKGKDLKFEAKIEVMPEPEVKDVADSKIELFDAPISKKDTDTMLADMRDKQGSYVEADREAKKLDQVTIDFEGFVGGEAFAGGKAEKYNLVLGSNSFIPGFEDQILGCKKDEEKTIAVTFPEDYQATELAGKDAEFKIKLHKIEEKQAAELDDKFFKALGVENLEELEKQIEDGLQNNLENALQNQKRNEVLKTLIELNELEVPPSYLESEIDRLKQDQEQQYAQYFGSLPQGLNLPRELFKEQAIFNAKSGILINTYAKKFEIKPEASETEEILQKFLKSYPNPKEMEQQIRANKEVMRSLDAMALEAKVINTLADKMKVKKVKKSFNEVVYPEQKEA